MQGSENDHIDLQDLTGELPAGASFGGIKKIENPKSRTSTNIPRELQNQITRLSEGIEETKYKVIVKAIEIYAALIADLTQDGDFTRSKTGARLTWLCKHMGLEPGSVVRVGTAIATHLLEEKAPDGQTTMFNALYKRASKEDNKPFADLIVDAVRYYLENVPEPK